MMCMNVISKRFKDAGLQDLLIQSGAIAEGSIDSALIGKICNRGVWCYKLMYEVLYHLLTQQIETHYQNVWNNQFIGEAKSKTEKAFPELSAENFTAFPDSQKFWNFYQLFLDFKLELQKNGSNLGKFWLSFIKLVEIF